ncbi:MAG: hypothetical protein IJX92_01965 [Clostridia bacterium]|nr:hypothetical protein [Clostridia bacterium]
MDFTKHIPEIEKKIRYTFKDKNLLTQAFTRASFCNEKNRRGENYMSNEVLEFFGDSVLSTAIITLMLEKKTERYRHGIKTDWNEGDFSNLRSKLSDKRNLSKSTAELGLQRYLIMGEGDKACGIENEPSVMEDLFESIIGAIYVDSGNDIKTVIKSVGCMLDVSAYGDTKEAPIQSYKNALQEWCADKSHRLPAPVYKTLEESGPDHKKSYKRACYIGDKLYGVGEGKNQKLADSAAAEATLLMLKEENAPKIKIDSDAPARLKELCAKGKHPSPEWRDLGETEKSTDSSKEFMVECRAMGKSAVGIANSKAEARALAARSILDAVIVKNKEKSDKASKKQDKKSYPKLTVKDKPMPKEAKGAEAPKPKQQRTSKGAHAPKKRPSWQKKHL